MDEPRWITAAREEYRRLSAEASKAARNEKVYELAPRLHYLSGLIRGWQRTKGESA